MHRQGDNMISIFLIVFVHIVSRQLYDCRCLSRCKFMAMVSSLFASDSQMFPIK